MCGLVNLLKISMLRKSSLSSSARMTNRVNWTRSIRVKSLAIMCQGVSQLKSRSLRDCFAVARRATVVANSLGMRIALEAARARWSFLLGILLIAGGLIFLASRVWLAAYWGESLDPDQLLRATILEPTNADYWNRLGFYEKWNFERRDLRRVVLYDQRATEADPRSDTYWMDLAEAYEAIGQPAPAREAFERAQSAHPISSEVAWRYGNFLLRQKDYSEAFAELRRALTTDPNLTVEAVSECLKASDDLPRILTDVLPNQNGQYLMALDYFLAQHQVDAAVTVWDRLRSQKPSAKMAEVVPLINELIGQERVEDALKIWRQALEATGWPRDEAGDSSLVFNGGFEHDVLDGAFDWREDSVAGAAFTSDINVVHSGGRALRITFDGSANLDFQNLWQFSPVEPNHHYHFAAYLRLEEISTDSGIRFAIHDAFHPAALQILSPDVIGSHPWSLVEADFVTGPETHLLTIALRRVPSWKFDNKLRGTVWVDDVLLVPTSEDTKDRPQ
jgi:tetratricopeptide (TPR) repeat protein